MKKFFILLCWVCAITNVAVGQTWVPYGADDANQPCYNVGISAMASDKSGGMYLAYSDYIWNVPFTSFSTKLSVRRWNNGSWQQVGLTGFSAGEALYVQLVVASAPTPYIVFRDNGNGRKAVVKTFNGNSWIDVGTSTISPGPATNTCIALDSAYQPYVAYVDSATQKVTVKRWIGTTWQTVGLPNFSPANVSNLKLAINKASAPYILIKYNTLGVNTTEVYKFSGLAWVSQGNPCSTASNPNWLDLALLKGDTAIVAFTDNLSAGRVAVKKYTGNGWVAMGAPDISPTAASSIHLLADTTYGTYLSCMSAPVLSFTNSINPMVRRYNGTMWTVTGADSFITSQQSDGLAFDLDVTGNPYVGYSDVLHGYKAIVRKLSGNTWGVAGTSLGLAMSVSHAFAAASADGKKGYFCTQEYDNGSKVFRCDDTGVVLIGQSGANTWNKFPSSIAVHPDGHPWIAAADGILMSGSVWRYADTGWANTYLNDSVYYSSMAFDASGTAYIGYIPTNSSGARIKKYSGSAWIDMPALPYPFLTGFVRVKTDRDGIPNVLVGSQTGGFYPQYTFQCYRLSGNSWNMLGNGISTSIGSTYQGIPDLAFDTANIPFIAYVNNTQNALKVQKYDSVSNTWNNVVPVTPATQGGYYPTIQFGADGSLFLAYADRYTSPQQHMTVQRLSGTSWQTVGASSFSRATSNNPNLLLLNNRMLGIFSDGATYSYKNGCQQPVSITQQPSNIIACTGGSIIFSTAASDAISYLWQVNDGLSWKNIKNIGSYSGSQTNSLTVSNITSAFDGLHYRCVYTNACAGTMISDQVLLSVAPSIAPSAIIAALPGTTISAGQQVSFTSTITNGGIATQYQWLRNSIPVAGATNATFTTTAIGDGDSIALRVVRSDTCLNNNTVSGALIIHVSSGIKINPYKTEIKIYPQPAENYIVISATDKIPAGKYHLLLRSTVGQTIYEEVVDINSTAWSHHLLLSPSISSGTYILTFQGGGVSINSRLIILR